MRYERLKYGELNEYQRTVICNGCGPKGGKMPVPNFLFKASCDKHDFGYWRGCRGTLKTKAKDRKICDLKFYKFMIIDCKNAGWFSYAWAKLYYLAVRLMGRKHYNWYDEKTSKDLP